MLRPSRRFMVWILFHHSVSTIPDDTRALRVVHSLVPVVFSEQVDPEEAHLLLLHSVIMASEEAF